MYISQLQIGDSKGQDELPHRLDMVLLCLCAADAGVHRHG